MRKKEKSIHQTGRRSGEVKTLKNAIALLLTSLFSNSYIGKKHKNVLPETWPNAPTSFSVMLL